MRDIMPFSPPFPRDDPPPDDLRLDDELRGDLAADDFAVLVEPDLAVREPPLLLRPLELVFDRADVVLRDEDDLELPLFEDALLEPLLLRPPPADALPPLRPAALFCAELPPRLDALLLLRPLDEAFPPLRPAALFCALLPPRLEVLLLRPPVELFFDEDELPDDRLLLVAAAPFLPAALF